MEFRLSRRQKCLVRVDERETEAVKIAVSNLERDIKKVFGEGITRQMPAELIVGTVGVSELIEGLTDTSELYDEQGTPRKEAYLQCVCDGRLVIIGSDRRGTIYGIYEFCEMIGVSPWYFMADVPVHEREEMVLEADYRKADYPSVEYRGIFINDEEELEAWVQNYMDESTIGVKTYEKIFELILRLKGNYIWPAMHVNSFNMVVENGALAERMGIVVGTSHCDMLMRSNNREWKPWIAKKGYTDAQYDYSIQGRNREILQEYWRESVEQNKDFEVCYTLGMRGIHDSGFETRDLEGKSEEEIRQAKVELLMTVIRDQQKILQETLGHDTMMTFVPYKEVLELYDNGMEIPEELTLVWANDNYGYIRRYPSEKEQNRKGGNGIYYHNSYWAPPSMSYVFFCSIPLAHTRNELQKAYNEGIRKLWVMNVGGIKPLEQEVSFFLRLGWEIGKEHALTQDVDAYVEDWINRTFSGNIGKETAKLLNDFSQLTNVRKVENMDYDAFSQTAYGDEAVVRIHAYEELFERGNAIYEGLPKEEKDAFFQMVLMRIHAAYFTNLQYYYGDRSTLMYNRGNMQAADDYTKKAFAFDDARRRMLAYYNTIMADGKWNGMVNPEGFPPPRAAMMPICTPSLSIGERHMTVHTWNEEPLCFVREKTKWIEIANGGTGEFEFEIITPDWLRASQIRGSVKAETRILITADDLAQSHEGRMIVKNLTDKTEITIPAMIQPVMTDCKQVEADGKVVVPADAAASYEGTGFHIIKRLGRGSGNLVEAQKGQQALDSLDYPIYLTSSGTFTLELHRFPSLDSTGRIRIGISVDGGEVQIIESVSNDEWRGSWKKNVLNNVDRLYYPLPQLEAGEHTISFHAIDTYFAFSRFVIYTKERKENNYIGITGNQQLPRLWDVDAWADDFYGKITLQPRPVEYAQPHLEEGNLSATDLICRDEQYADTVEPSWYLEQGSHMFREENGAYRIDAASVLTQSEYAYTTNYEWQHCSSESYGRSGIAMYVRQPELTWETMNAPTLNYKLSCQNGGTYTVWLLSKFSTREEAYIGMGMDGVVCEQESLYQKGSMWRYAAEQIYRWVPIGKVEMTEGEHILQIHALSSGMRFDRIYVTRGKELPPMDQAWR